MNNIYLEEISNIQNIKNIYEKLISVSQGKDVDFNEEDNTYIKRIIINNQLMMILNVLEVFKNYNNSFSKEINNVFLEFFKKVGVYNISNDNILNYINLFRNAIAHHNDIIYEFSNEKSDKLTVKKESKDPYDSSSIDLELTIENLQNLNESLIAIFNENNKIKNKFETRNDF